MNDEPIYGFLVGVAIWMALVLILNIVYEVVAIGG